MRTRAILVMLAVAAVLAAVLFVSRRPPRTAAVAEPQHYVWLVEMDQLAAIRIRLPRQKLDRAWVKRDDQYWYFDEPKGPQVDMKRWGGGVPLLLSGPGANRRLTASATAGQLSAWGLSDPRMRIDLALEDGKAISILVGDPTPDGQACYIALAGSPEAYTVDYTWYDVMDRLVRDPPYPRSTPQGN
jgi:hypothetical protein